MSTPRSTHWLLPAGRRRRAGAALITFGLMLVGLFALPPTPTPLLLWLLLCAWVGYPLHTASTLVKVTADDDGWTEYRWPWGRRRRRWDEILAVWEPDPEHALAITRDGTLELSPRLAGWAQLLARARTPLDGEAEAPAEEDVIVAIPPQQVAAWLGTAPGEALVCTSAWWRRLDAAGLALLGLNGVLLTAVAVWAWTVNYPTWRWAALLAGLLTGGAYLGLAGCVWADTRAKRRLSARLHELRAAPDGLDVRSDAGWRRYAWGSLKHLEQRGRYWILSTAEGDLRLPPGLTRREVLLHAVRCAIEARQAGLELPRLGGDVPETALSRAEPMAVDAGRGLSREGER